MFNKTNLIWMLLITSVVSYLVFVTLSFHKPIRHDEAFWVSAAASMCNDSIIPMSSITQSRLYTNLLGLFFRIFGVRVESGHLLGIISFLVMLVVIYKIAVEVFEEQETKRIIGMTACALYAINPLVIQMSLLISEENVLTLVLALFILCFLKAQNISGIKGLVYSGLMLGLVGLTKPFWVPLLILIITIPYIVKRGLKKGFYELFTLSVIGISTYLVLWWIQSEIMGLSFLSPFTHHKVAIIQSLLAKIPKLPLGMIREGLWLPPYFMMLGIIATGVRIKEFWNTRKIALMDFLIVYVWMTLFGFIFFISFSIPRYSFPMMSMLSVIVAWLIVQSVAYLPPKRTVLFSIITLLFIVYNIAVVGDLLYILNHDLKVSLINNDVSAGLLKFSLKSLLYLIPLPIIFFIIMLFRKKAVLESSDTIANTTSNIEINKQPKHGLLKTLVLSLLIVTVSANMALNIMQAQADYDTGFGYGSKGTEELLDFFEENLGSNSVILADIGITCNYNIRKGKMVTPYSLGIWKYPYSSGNAQKDSQLFISTMRKKGVECVVYDISTNTAYQIKKVLQSREVQSFLQHNFERTQIGTYTVWLRKVN